MTQKIRLGERLLRIAEMVTSGASIIDVGTDHAYLPAYLLQNELVKSAKASDINLGPIQKAEATIRRYELLGKLELKQCPGLRDFSPNDADTIIIAGMGGEMIASILDQAPWVCDGEHRLLLQPMSSNEDLRCYLFNHHYYIMDERLALDSGRIYAILDVKGGYGLEVEYKPFEKYASRHVLKEELAGVYLENVI
ncbi:MAG: class I SAM-dependent methyltransferase, partial [Clostridiales bacterium]|nr:class I SAM-dependent methyltransferase [Clostridiales bacterium]